MSAMKRTLIAAVIFLAAAAAGRAAEVAAEPQPQLEAVSAERREQLARRFPTVIVHKRDGGQVKGVLTSYSTETGAAKGTYFIRDQETDGPPAKLKVIPGEDVAKVEITGFVERTSGHRPEQTDRIRKLVEAARDAGREAFSDLRRARDAGKVKEYAGRQEAALGKANSIEEAIAAVVKLRAAYVEAEGGRFAIRGNEAAGKRVNDKVTRALEAIENPTVKTETGLILHAIKQAGERIRNWRDHRPGGRRRPGGMGPAPGG